MAPDDDNKRDFGRGGYKNSCGPNLFLLSLSTLSEGLKNTVALDTGCSQDSFNDRAAFTTYQDFAQPRSVSGHGGSIQAKGFGTAVFVCDINGVPTPIMFINANHVPDIPLNLIVMDSGKETAQ